MIGTMFGVLGDPHILKSKHRNSRRLERNVDALNNLNLDFVLVTGDLSEWAKIDELKRAKKILDNLNTEYYCCRGNHDAAIPNNYESVFGPVQYAVKVGNYNLLVLDIKWSATPLTIDHSLPSIVLTHKTSRTDQHLRFPLFDNPELDVFLAKHNVTCVIQGHVHKVKHKEAYHKGVRYINCAKLGVGLGILDKTISYTPVLGAIEKARLDLLDMHASIGHV